jgi:hypothetical protein
VSRGSVASLERPVFTGSALLAFLREEALDGRMNEATAAVHGTAVRKMLGSLADWRHADVAALDADVLFAALLAREGGVLKRSTLETYRDTYQRAVAMFLEWGPAPRDRRPQRLVGRRRARLRGRASRHPEGTSEHVLPLAGDRQAQMVLPADLTPLEARRLSGFLEALASRDARSHGARAGGALRRR